MMDYETWRSQTKSMIFASAVVQLSMKFSATQGSGHHRWPWPMGEDMEEITKKAESLADAWEATTAP